MAPVNACRILPEEDATGVAAERVCALLERLEQRNYSPLFVFDGGYDPVKLQRELDGSGAQLLVYPEQADRWTWLVLAAYTPIMRLA